MLRIQVPILEVTDNSNVSNLERNKDQYIITENACEEAVKNYKDKEPIIVVLGKNPAGRLISLNYDKEHKVLVADLEVYLNFAGACSILNQIETLDGKRILNLKIGAVQIVPDINEINKMISELPTQQEGE